MLFPLKIVSPSFLLCGFTFDKRGGLHKHVSCAIVRVPLLARATLGFLNILIFEPGTLKFHFAVGLANHVAGSATRINKCPTQVVLSNSLPEP